MQVCGYEFVPGPTVRTRTVLHVAWVGAGPEALQPGYAYKCQVTSVFQVRDVRTPSRLIRLVRVALTRR